MTDPAKPFLVDRKDPSAAPNSHRSLNKATQFLRSESQDADKLEQLKAIWKQTVGAKSGRVPNTRKMIEELAPLLVDGRLRTVETKPAGGGGGNEEKLIRPPPRKPYKPPVRREAPLKIRPRPEPEAPKAPDPEIDTARQVAALRAAAESGAPFCEQCQ